MAEQENRNPEGAPPHEKTPENLADRKEKVRNETRGNLDALSEIIGVGGAMLSFLKSEFGVAEPDAKPDAKPASSNPDSSPVKKVPVAEAPVAEAPVSKTQVAFEKAYGRILEDLAAKYGVAPKLITAFVKAESGFNTNAVNKSSGASGFGQFVRSTWGAFEAFKGQGSLNRLDPSLGLEAIAWLLRENSKALTRMGYAVNLSGPSLEDVKLLYMVHHSGPTGTKKILQALNGKAYLPSDVPSTYRKTYKNFADYARFVSRYADGVVKNYVV